MVSDVNDYFVLDRRDKYSVCHDTPISTDSNIEKECQQCIYQTNIPNGIIT